MLQITKGQRKKAKKQQKAVVQLTESTPAAPSPMDGASSAPATTSGAELQVCPLTNFALIIVCAFAGHISAYVQC